MFFPQSYWALIPLGCCVSHLFFLPRFSTLSSSLPPISSVLFSFPTTLSPLPPALLNFPSAFFSPSFLFFLPPLSSLPAPFSYPLHPSFPLLLLFVSPSSAPPPRLPPPHPVPPRPAPPRLRRPRGATQAACPGGAERAPSGEHSVPERPRPPTCAPARSARANNGYIVAAGGESRPGPCSWRGRKKARGPGRGARLGHSVHLSRGHGVLNLPAPGSPS